MRNINGINVLEEFDIRRTCPSFYAKEPKDTMSEKYTLVNTYDIAHHLWDLGWMPTLAKEAQSKDPSNRGLTRHIVRWAHRDFVDHNERIELVGINSHNGSAAFRFEVGIFRFICENGMIVKSSDLGSFRIKHIGDIGEQVHAAVDGLSRNAHQIAGKVDTFKTIELTRNEQGVFAVAAHGFLYDGKEQVPIEPQDLLSARRYEDVKDNSLWATYNTIQENILKGGLRGRTPRGRRTTTREVKSIDRDVKLNQALWQMTERMAELKAA